MGIIFEYDAVKSKINSDKHGIDFEKAAQLWKDEYRYVIAAESGTEPRYIMIATLQKNHWSTIFTYRKASIRIISVRRARKKEIEIYEQAKKATQH